MDNTLAEQIGIIKTIRSDLSKLQDRIQSIEDTVNGVARKPDPAMIGWWCIEKTSLVEHVDSLVKFASALSTFDKQLPVFPLEAKEPAYRSAADIEGKI